MPDLFWAIFLLLIEGNDPGDIDGTLVCTYLEDIRLVLKVAIDLGVDEGESPCGVFPVF